MVSAVNSPVTILSAPSSFLSLGGQVATAAVPVAGFLQPDAIVAAAATLSPSLTGANTLALLSKETAGAVLSEQSYREPLLLSDGASSSLFDFFKTFSAFERTSASFNAPVTAASVDALV